LTAFAGLGDHQTPSLGSEVRLRVLVAARRREALFRRAPRVAPARSVRRGERASLDRETQSAEHTSYATATSLDGPWTYRGELTKSAANSFTIHAGIAEFKDQWYIFLHNATLTVGDQSGAVGRRPVTVEYLQYNPDGTLKPIIQTDAGMSVPPPPAT
jgi:hypothetical protein